MTARLTFDAAQHVYTLDGRALRSVTQILQLVGLVRFDGVPPGQLEAARVRGSIVHQAIHYYNDLDLDVVEFTRTFPNYAGYLQSWIALTATGRLQTALCEHRVACLQFAGTFDWLGTFDGAAALLDFATGDPADAAKHLQTAAYVMAAQYWQHEPTETTLAAFLSTHPAVARYSVALQRDGRLPVMTPYRDPRDFGRFRAIAHAVEIVAAERTPPPSWDWSREDRYADRAAVTEAGA